MQTFKKCDLHLHSSSCESRNYLYEDFEKALLESDLDVIAITDHNSVDVELLNTLSKKLSAKNITVLAGVELNVTIDEATRKEHNLVISKETDYFHGIVWCDLVDAKRLQDVVFRLLDKIGISSQYRSGRTAKEISALSKGKAFSLVDVQRELGSLKYFFTFHESKGDNRRNLSGYLKNGKGGNDKFKESLFYYNQRLAIEGGKKSKPISDFFEYDLNTIVCRFFCSDAKTLDKIGSAFTWIDFDGDIDSFNLAITDPQSRVVTSDESDVNPQSNLNAFLESVKFDLLGKDGSSTECEIEFAPSFNGIVGSRGSGKSMLARILTGRVSDGHEKHVDPESVRFRMRGGQYSKNSPRFLYVKQGELGAVFDTQDYKSVPFLNEKLKGLRDSAKAASDEHYSSVKKELESQEGLLFKFVDQYNGDLKRPDALQDAKPSGISIKSAPLINSEQSDIERLREQVKRLIERIESEKETTNNLAMGETFPEASMLRNAVDARLAHAAASLDMAISDLSSIYDSTSLLTAEPFTTREFLVKSFSDEINETNRDKSLGVHNYDTILDETNQFLDDLLELRIRLSKSTRVIEESIEGMLRPISQKAYQTDENRVTIGLSVSDATSFEDSLKAQIKSSIDSSTAIINFALMCSDLRRAKSELLNMSKYRNQATASAVIGKLYSNIKSDLSKNSEFEINVSFDGTPVKEMSPGMQAQALLKLLLNDELLSGDYDYVVLDQPEDNLDTPTISAVLVNRIKHLKKNVQVFIVSHSAPVIINGDARNIIMAVHGGTRIEYSSGVINGQEAKEFISDVLDGGERFLKMRLYKYDFQVGEKDD